MKSDRYYGTSRWLDYMIFSLIAAVASLGTAQAVTIPSIIALPSLDASVDKPTAVAVDGAGRVYVAESMSNRVRMFAQGGGLLTEITGLAKPISVAADPAGRIYVGSAWQGSVSVYDGSRTFLFKLGVGDNEFTTPVDIDIDGGGQIYVTDQDSNTIRVYNPAGQYVKSIGIPGTTPPAGNGQLWHPCSLAIDPVTSELVVLDQQQVWDNYAKTWIDGARIQFFSMAGAFLRGYAKFGYNMDSGQLVKPVGVAVDPLSRVYVSDARLQKVMVYDNSDVLLGIIDNSAAPLRTPLGLAMAATGRLYVSALLSGRVDFYGIDSYSAMDVRPAAVSFTAMEGGAAPAPQDTTITNSGKAELAWSATTAADWLSLPATAGTLPPSASGAIGVAVQPEGLAPGTYQGSIKVSAPGMEELVAVTLTVKPNPLSVSPAILAFTANEGSTPAAQSLSVSTGGEQVSWTAAADQSWLFLNKTAGTGPGAVKVYANTVGLGPGSYSGTITFLNLTGGKSLSVAVSLGISEATEPPGEPQALPLPGEGEVQAGGKRWRVTQPVPGVDLSGISGVDYRNMLAVGEHGTILGYDGRSWRAMSSDTESALRSIWVRVMETGYDAYAVGDGGIALHYDGTAWSRVATDRTEALADVWGAAEVLAVGGYGMILNLNQATAGYENPALRAIWGSSANDVFVAGESGAILHSAGASWSAMASDTSQWLNALWGSSENDVFAVGENGTIVHYNGTVWSTMESGVYETLHGVYGDAPNNVYAVGDNAVVLHFDGTAWSVLLAGGISLRDVWVADRLVVAVGDDGTILTGKGGDPGKGPGRKPKAALTGGRQDQGSKVGTGEVLQTPMLRGTESR
ncbi:MAG: BACON domain-containing protein [Desulfobulbaceae bacterium]